MRKIWLEAIKIAKYPSRFYPHYATENQKLLIKIAIIHVIKIFWLQKHVNSYNQLCSQCYYDQLYLHVKTIQWLKYSNTKLG